MEAEGEPEIEPHRVDDNFRREAVVPIADGGEVHPKILLWHLALNNLTVLSGA